MGFQPSLSHYYHTGFGAWFVGALSAIGVFLFSYDGYSPRQSEFFRDSHVTNAAGLFALGVALFPTRFNDTDKGQTNAADQLTCVVDRKPLFWPYIESYELVGRLHLISAGLLFVCLAIMCFLFTRHELNADMKPEKLVRNRVYYICGIGIITCIAFMFARLVFTDFALGFDYDLLVFESIAIILFGLAWLTKSEVILKDAQ